MGHFATFGLPENVWNEMKRFQRFSTASSSETLEEHWENVCN
jgi:hypothetical protein